MEMVVFLKTNKKQPSDPRQLLVEFFHMFYGSGLSFMLFREKNLIDSSSLNEMFFVHVDGRVENAFILC